MTKAVMVVALATVFCGMLPAADASPKIDQEILALERKAMDGWLAGDPDAALTMSDDNITYFHAVTGGRLDGLAAVRKLYEGYRGSALFDSYEIVDPKVQGAGDTLVLSYVLERRVQGVMTRWNATQVYQRTPNGWRVIHTHWSMTNPPRP